MSFRMFRALVVCSAFSLAPVAMAQGKVAVISLQKSLFDTAEIKKADADLQSKLKPRQDQLDKLNQEMQQIAQKLQTDTNLTQQQQIDLNAEGNRRKTEATRLQEDLQSDFNDQKQQILTKAGERMQAIVKKLAEDKGIDLVVDTQVALFFKPTMDLTGEATAAYDKAYPASAPAAAPPAKK